ncbi:MAG: DegV family protein [Clostridia bacterium]|nr:DegV family protein [Clostridia bacterium]
MSKFFCDSNSELWYTKADELGLKVIGMPYTLDDIEKDYDLGRNTDFDYFYNRIKKGGIAKTQALNVQNYLDYFEPVLKNGDDIIYVHFSNQMSGTFEYMKQAIAILKEKYPERTIKYVDTLLISVGEALEVYEAGKMWKNGATDDEIIKFIEDYRQNYAVYFLVDDLGHLKRGGRLSASSFIVGTVLNIKPILKMDEIGKIVKHGVASGKKKGIKELANIVKNTGLELDKHPIIIAHAQAEELANELKKILLEEIDKNLDIWVQPIGPTVGTHCGPGSIGVTFYAKHR